MKDQGGQDGRFKTKLYRTEDKKTSYTGRKIKDQAGQDSR